MQNFVAFHWVVTELWDFKHLKVGQTLHANMEGFHRDSHIWEIFVKPYAHLACLKVEQRTFYLNSSAFEHLYANAAT